MAPIGLILLFLTGVGPLLAWRKSTLTQPARSVPVADARRRRHRRRARGARARRSGRRGCVSRCARSWSARSARSSGAARACAARSTGTDLFTALIGLVGRNKRRYGGYIVHVGIVLMFLGFAGKAYKHRRAGAAEARAGGDGRQVHDPQRRHQGERRWSETDDARPTSRCSRAASRSTRCIRRGGSSVSTRTSRRPRSAIRRDFWRGPLRRAAGRRSRNVASRRRPLQIVINPLVNWIWLGFGVMAFGTGIALLPERAFSFAMAKMPADGGRDDSGRCVPAACCSASRRVSAQMHGPAPGDAIQA